MKAIIKVPLSHNQKQLIHDALKPDMRATKRAKSEIRIKPRGLEILIKASDVPSLRASMNTCLKLLETSLKVMNNARTENTRASKGKHNENTTIPAAITGINDSKTKHTNPPARNR